jgi:uncharacterized protein YqeY
MIKSKLDQDLKSAMLAGDKRLVSVLRGIKSAILYVEIAEDKRGSGLSDKSINDILQKESKKRSDTIQIYETAGEKEKAAAERYEQDVINGYLPKQLTDQELESIIDRVIDDLPDKPTMQSMGSIIADVKDKTNGTADGSAIAKLVREKISQ